MELFIQFRDGRALASHVLVDGKFYSPGGIGQHEMAPNVALDNVEGLRFDGTKLQGDWKWVRGAVETIPFDATVRDGLVTGKAGQADLTGWLRSEEQMAQANGLAPERNWPSRTGPREDWSGIDTGAKLTTDFSKSLLVWFSEAEFGGGRETRRCHLRWLSGSWSPVVGEGRIFFIHQQPAGEVIDDAAQKYAQGLLDKLLARPNVLLDPYLTPNAGFARNPDVRSQQESLVLSDLRPPTSDLFVRTVHGHSPRISWQKRVIKALIQLGASVQESSANESRSEIVLVVVLVVETEDEDEWVHASSVCGETSPGVRNSTKCKRQRVGQRKRRSVIW